METSSEGYEERQASVEPELGGGPLQQAPPLHTQTSSRDDGTCASPSPAHPGSCPGSQEGRPRTGPAEPSEPRAASLLLPTGAWELSLEEACPRQTGMPNSWDPQTRGQAAPQPHVPTPSPGMWETEVLSQQLLCWLTWAGQSPRSSLHPVSSHRYHHTGFITQVSSHRYQLAQWTKRPAL